MRDNIVGFYISFVRQKKREEENSFLMQYRRTNILAYVVLLPVLRSLFVWIPVEAFVLSALVIRSA